jgi:WD40 repeat protein/quinohemoprotein amine dehydrogenase alpha subunit-like protein
MRERHTARRLLVVLTIGSLLAGGCTFVRQVTRDANGNDGNAQSSRPRLDNDGGYMTFQSDANNLVAGDTNGVTDVFKVDTMTGHLERPSVASDGTQANGPSRNPGIDCCGGYIVFESDATNLVPGDTNGRTDVFVHSQITKQTMLVSVASGGGPTDGDSTSPVISSDGKWIAFESTATNIVPGVSGHQIYARQWQTTGPTVLISASSCTNGVATGGNGVSTGPHISQFGTTITFTSTSTNFGGDPGNGAPNAYVAPVGGCSGANVPALVGVDATNLVLAGGSVATSIDGDGQVVAYDAVTDLCAGHDPCRSPTDVYVRNRATGTSRRVNTGGAAGGGYLNGSGTVVAFQTGWPNVSGPVAVVVTVATGATRVISTDASGQPRPVPLLFDASADGPVLNRFTGYVAYAAAGASAVQQVFVQTTQPPPTVSGVSPASVARGTTDATLIVSGTGFVSGATVYPPGGVTVDSTAFVSSSTLQIHVHVAADAPTGAGDVVVAVPGELGLTSGSAGSCHACLTVT